MGKITDNVKKIEFKCQILEKWHHRGPLLAKNTKAWHLFCSNFLKQSVTKIKMRQKFSAYPGKEVTGYEFSTCHGGAAGPSVSQSATVRCRAPALVWDLKLAMKIAFF